MVPRDRGLNPHEGRHNLHVLFCSVRLNNKKELRLGPTFKKKFVVYLIFGIIAKCDWSSLAQQYYTNNGVGIGNKPAFSSRGLFKSQRGKNIYLLFMLKLLVIHLKVPVIENNQSFLGF